MFIVRGRPRWNTRPGRLGPLMAAMFLALVWALPAYSQQGAAVDNVVTDIKTAGTGSEQEITIFTARRPDSSVFTMSAPSRIVVDIAETTPGKFASPVVVNKGPVKDIVAREFKDAEGTITRVTIQLDTVVDYTHVTGDNSITIKLKPRAEGAATPGDESGEPDLLGEELAKMDGGAQPPSEKVEEITLSSSPSVREPEGEKRPATATGASTGSAEVTGLDFLPYEKQSRLRISSSRPLKYVTSPANKDRVVIVDLADARLPKQLQRPLDTSEFPSAVKMVSAYPLKGKDKTVRVAIKLREKVDFKVVEEGNRLYLDFPVPKSVASRLPAEPTGAASVSPSRASSSPSEPQSSSGSAPKLISSRGEVLDSNAARGDMQAAGMVAVTTEDTLGSTLYTGRKISIDVREADLHNVFRMISNVSKLNVVAADNVTGKVTVRLQNVPWDQALAVILQSKGLGAVRFGNIIRIAPLTVLKEERKQQAEAIEASEKLEKLQTMVLPLNYAIATEIKSQVEPSLSARGKLTIDSRTNALIIEDLSENLKKIRELTESLDTPTPQVLIEARIVEVSSSYLWEMGVQWGGDVNASANTGVSTGLYFPNSIFMSGGYTEAGQANRANSGTPNWVVDLPSASKGGALSLSLGSISDIINIDARLSALESFGKGKVISSPKVTTVDNREATISQGTRIPYETVSAAGTAVQFIEATLRLKVQPHITQDNRVFLTVTVSNNRPDFGQSVNGNPAIEVKEATTVVMVKDGDTTVLGGVYTLNESETTAGIPGFHKIPLLGWLFKHKLERSERKELLVFITPHILTRKTRS